MSVSHPAVAHRIRTEHFGGKNDKLPDIDFKVVAEREHDGIDPLQAGTLIFQSLLRPHPPCHIGFDSHESAKPPGIVAQRLALDEDPVRSSILGIIEQCLFIVGA